MRGNHFESVMGVLGFGESHGKVSGVVLEDVKGGVIFPLEEIQRELDKRRPGKGNYASTRQEADRIEVLSGVMDGITTGMPICLVVYNQDQRTVDYKNLQEIFRPGHADYSWYRKFKIWDWRGGGRASGRETIARVAAGAVVKEMLSGIKIESYPVQIGKVGVENISDNFPNPISWPDPGTYDDVLYELSKAQEANDSLGGIVELRILGVPAGLGDPVFGKLDAKLAGALISIGGVKGIEFGGGFSLAGMRGSEANDQMGAGGFLSNNCGGILGGISTGEEILIHLAVKPTSSIESEQKTIDKDRNEHLIEIKGRHDTCILMRILPVTTAMVRLVLADCLSYQKLQEEKKLDLNDYREALDKIDEDILLSLRRREEISRLIGKWKNRHGKAVTDGDREQKLMDVLKEKAGAWQLDAEMVNDIWRIIIKQSKEIQENS
ncbi:MAG: chorismate synthase [Candidatus Cloacimonetes bacterium]|nr:chorismate synthase [Candidatus Cloacimonadota bacterium]